MEATNNIINDNTWQKVIMKYNKPDVRKSIWQICNSLIPYILMWYIMYRSLAFPYWITMVLSVIASGFLIRLFIIFHDCGHGSFFRSQTVNAIIGTIFGLFAFTHYRTWHNQHRIHHATAGNLDKRGVGDVWTLTTEEFKTSSKWRMILYRLFRNPYLMLTIGPIYVFMFQNRLTTCQMSSKERINIYFTNIALLIIAVLISMFIGFKDYLLIQLPILFFSHCIGIWLFYLQHQFGEVFWDRNSKWDYKTAALEGSAFLKFPAILQWFTGNIGFHHVHHLSSMIPNYNLAKCHYENDLFKKVKAISFLASFKGLNLGLWDEKSRQMVSFKEARISHYSIWHSLLFFLSPKVSVKNY